MTDRAGTGGLRAQRQWVGAEGLAAFRATVPCSVQHPRAFRVRTHQAQIGAVRLEEWWTSELAFDATSRDEALLLQVLRGAVRCTDPTERWSATSDQLVVLAPLQPRRWSFAAGSHLRLVRVPAALVRPDLLEAVESGVLAPAPSTAALVTALTGLGDAALRPMPSEFVGDGLRALVLAVLEERRRDAAGSSHDLRLRIQRFVGAHLGDPDLTPASIAAAFAVSLRWVHQAFNRDGETLAQHIRERRADAVADVVRRGGWAVGTGALAEAYGFSGREHLGRVFRARYGMTVAEFRAAVAAGERPVPLTEPVAAPVAAAG